MRAFLALLMLTLASCTSWKTHYESRSPDGKVTVRVLDEAHPMVDTKVKVVVESAGQTFTVAERSDCWPAFTYIAWSGSTFSLVMDGAVCGGLTVAYDVAARRTVDFDLTRPWVAASLIKKFEISEAALRPYDGDVIRWALKQEIYPVR